MKEGGVASLPAGAPLLKKSTRTTEPSESAALAVTPTVAGAVNAAPFAGAVIDTVGGTFGGVKV